MGNRILLDPDMNLGCWADGASGHAYVRGQIAATLNNFGFEDSELIQSLQGPMPDDAWDEYEAIDWLDSNAPVEGGWWGFWDGDFGCWEEEP